MHSFRLVQIFISYRRSDTQSASRHLAEALKLRFGSEHVFFDTRDIAAGVEWRSDTMRRVQRVGRRSRHHRPPLGGDCGGSRPPERAGPQRRGPGASGDRDGLHARGDRHSRTRGRRRDAGPRHLAATVQTARRRSGTDPSPCLVGPRRRCPRGGPRPPPAAARAAARVAAGQPACTARSYGRRSVSRPTSSSAR